MISPHSQGVVYVALCCWFVSFFHFPTDPIAIFNFNGAKQTNKPKSSRQ
jgi:hypothetical protein